MNSAAEKVFATLELYELIAERAFDPERVFTAEQLEDVLGERPPAWHDLATLASLARVNRSLARMPWPSAAGTAHVALGHEAEAERRRLAPDVEGDSAAALAARAAIKVKLELGLAAVARACDALDAELGDAGSDAAHARAPGSAAERAYRACLLYSAVDVLWRGEPYSRTLLLPEPPPQLARALCAFGTNARLPAELRAASLATLGAVMSRLGRFASDAMPSHDGTATEAAELTRQERLVNAELSAVLDTLGGAIEDSVAGADSSLPVGPLGLALAAMLDQDAHGGGIARSNLHCRPCVLLLELHASLCALFANPLAPIGARACAGAASEQYGCYLVEEAERENYDYPSCLRAKGVIDELDTSGASTSYRALNVDRSLSLNGGEAGRRRHGQRHSPPTLVMPVSRSHLLFVARRLHHTVDCRLDNLVFALETNFGIPEDIEADGFRRGYFQSLGGGGKGFRGSG